jgi:uncharacterized membrane protein
MRPTRKIVAEFLGVFLIGSLAGGLVTWSYTDRQLTTFMTRSNSPESMVARINVRYEKDYHLTPDEMKRIQPQILAMARHVYLVRHQFGLDVLNTFDSYHEKIAEQLTPEHRAAYEAGMATRHKVMSDMLLPDQTATSQGMN